MYVSTGIQWDPVKSPTFLSVCIEPFASVLFWAQSRRGLVFDH